MRYLTAGILIMLAPLAFAEEKATVAGKVADANGKPVEHATVLVYEAGVRKGYSIYCPTCWTDCGKRATTDANGSYSIGGLNPELVFNLLVIGDGYSTTFLKKTDPAKGPADTAVLKTRTPPEDPAQAVRGLIVDGRGKPVRDAVIEQQGVTYRDAEGRLGTMFGGARGWLDAVAVTNEKGEFEVAFGKPAESMILNVSPRGMSAKLVTLPTGSERKTVTVTDGAMIHGRLMQDGKPVANAEIGVSTHSRNAANTLPEVRIGTREDGTFAITNIPAGRVYYLYAKMESLAARGIAAELIETETKDDGQEVDVGDIQVKPGLTLRGKVVLSDRKTIPPDMHMNLSADRARDTQSVVIAEDGSFEFKGLSKGVYEFAAPVKGYRLPDGQTGEVLVDRDKELTIRLLPAAPNVKQ